ncbi:MAG: ferrous iron transport protein B [Saprospiraceae bacterium]|nr:ferrous iron transport protein B [Saprospiraceae bacterium]
MTSSVKTKKIALVGNPNCGKSHIFNALTGARQRVGNYPGVTIDLKEAAVAHADHHYTLVDLPGTYSVYPHSDDERVTIGFLLQQKAEKPDLIAYIANASDLDRQLLLFSQLRDMGFPIMLVCNLMDVDAADLEVDTRKLEDLLSTKVLIYDSRDSAKSNEQLLQSWSEDHESRSQWDTADRLTPANMDSDLQNILADRHSAYERRVILHNRGWLELEDTVRIQLDDFAERGGFQSLQEQVKDTMARLHTLESKIPQIVSRPFNVLSRGQKADAILTHSFWGLVIFAFLMLLVFQAIFAWSSYPMDLIEGLFGTISAALSEALPEGHLTDLLTEGIIPGLAGVLVFIPQIAVLFVLIGILEQVGYMARAVYLFDHILLRFGMNGRSIVALISGGACAIPAIMSTRTIANWKERLITILVTPFISCSARIPVYTLLIAFVVPYKQIGLLFNSQGLVFAGLYLLGILAALLSGWVLKKWIKSNKPSMLALEMPTYQWPNAAVVLRNAWDKVWSFISEAGKIILIVSIVLWFLASFGPPGAVADAKAEAEQTAMSQGMNQEELQHLEAALIVEHSFAGKLGKALEPIIAPLGFDWRMGIGILSAFAAREVFVGSMATLYSVGQDAEEQRLRDVLANQRDPVTGQPVFNFASALSLLLFFVFAMQCVSTLAVVRSETKSWKWPLLQFLFMTGIAYLASLCAFQFLS